MPRDDAFATLARYYDAIMSHVEYGRWETIASALSGHLPRDFRHLDVACGTGRLLESCLRSGWNSVGTDLSPGMLHAAQGRVEVPYIAADMCALPFANGFDLITCLFDSLNFVLDEEGVQRSLASFAAALRPGGMLYFDIVTERMVTEYFEGPAWTEDNQGFETTWKTNYDRATGTAETVVRVNRGETSLIRERIYDQAFIEDALRAAGLSQLVCVDAETWEPPKRKTVRIDFIACKPPPGGLTTKKIMDSVKSRLA